MKLSVSLPAADVEYLDEYAQTQRIGSLSAALHLAVRRHLALQSSPGCQAPSPISQQPLRGTRAQKNATALDPAVVAWEPLCRPWLMLTINTREQMMRRLETALESPS